MTWTAPGAWFGNSSNTSGPYTVTETNQAVGNLLVVEVQNFSNSTVWATGLTGGGATWVQAGVKFSGTTNALSAAVFLGTVTTTGSVTITVTWSGTGPANFGIAGREFHSTVGSWTYDKRGTLDVGAGNANWASLTPTFGAGELYFGYAANLTSATAGSTSGYVYNATVDGVGNGAAYNLNCPATATFPVWGDAEEAFGIMILVVEGSPQIGPPATFYPRPSSRVVTVPFLAGVAGAQHSR